MAGLADIAPEVVSLDYRGASVDCFGVSGGGVAYLLRRHAELRKLFSDLFAGVQVGLGPEDFISLGPAVAASVIAVGATAWDENQSKWAAEVAKAERVAAMMPIASQLEFLSVIIKLTMPDGAGPFVERLTASMGALGLAADPSATAPVTK